MINHFVHVSLYKDGLGTISRSEETKKSFVLSYPCSSNYYCTPYVLKLKEGTYKFECWGSSATTWKSTPGLGGYTSGIMYINQETTFYVYIGAQGFFNAMKERNASSDPAPGGATDVRLNYSENWWDNSTLISRIMVAAGGGAAEWDVAIGGNGGGLNGTPGQYYSTPCLGATQTSGSECGQRSRDDVVYYSPSKGSFGSAGVIDPVLKNDYGAIGGGGYYGGTSYPYSFSGSGGSSFISGHQGCDAVKEQTENIEHTGQPNHYSGFVFTNTVMISGNSTMPLPTSSSERSIHYGLGAFRLTLVHYQYHSTYRNQIFRFIPFVLIGILK